MHRNYGWIRRTGTGLLALVPTGVPVTPFLQPETLRIVIWGRPPTPGAPGETDSTKACAKPVTTTTDG